MKMTWSVAIVTGALLVPWASGTAATVTVPAEFSEIVADASLIVRGRVTTIRTFRESTGQISTVATVLAQAVLKGTHEAFVSVVVPGGDIAGRRVIMVGAPRLAVNDTAVFFLWRGADNLWRPVGLAQGIYRVQVSAATGSATVAPPVMLNRTASAGSVQRGDVRRRALPLREFDALVRLAAAGPRRPLRPVR